jgi:hypothetical protein
MSVLKTLETVSGCPSSSTLVPAHAPPISYSAGVGVATATRLIAPRARRP